MHNKPLSLAKKFLAGCAIALGVLLTGCTSVSITNLTAPSLPENPSQIYTISLRVTTKSGSVVKKSIKPSIVIDGKNYPMPASPMGDGLFEFDYQLPPGRDEIAYYFLVQYLYEARSGFVKEEAFSELQHANIARRYVLSLEVNRGPVGARVSVLGRGFTPNDAIYFDNLPARTVYESANAISFYVPAVEANRNYKIMLGSTAGNSPVGTFRVDATNVQVFPDSLHLRSGETQSVTFTLPYAAAQGGLLLDVTTDVPESVIMPEVVVPAGQNSVTIPVQGGKKGTGMLYLKGYGQGEVTIPVTVQ